MQTLNQPTAAKRIYSHITQDGKTVILSAGTRYKTTSITFDPLGYTVKRITVKGEQYEILE